MIVFYQYMQQFAYVVRVNIHVHTWELKFCEKGLQLQITPYDFLWLQYAQSELCPSAEHRVELIAGSGVYVTLTRLEEARREAKNGTQLARKLMDAFWDRETLARSSLSSKSKFQYQQLDPNVINAIEGMQILIHFLQYITSSICMFSMV